MQHNNPNSPLLSNQGKIVSGTDRAGRPVDDHGPRSGPGDRDRHDAQRRQLDDDIDTIQIIGSNPRTTYVTGTVICVEPGAVATARSSSTG